MSTYERRFWKYFSVSAAAVILLTSSRFAAGQISESVIIDKFIAQQAKTEGGDEYREARKVISGDVNGDGKADRIALYSLEGFGGGNSYRQYLAVFLSKGNSFRYAANMVVGGKLYRDIDLVSVRNGKVYLDTMEYRQNDAACCPSKKGKARVELVKGRLREIK